MEVNDQIFLGALKKIYHQVSTAPDNSTKEGVRLLSSNLTKEAFSHVNFQILGSENLPYRSNCIFIYNHLDNHPSYTVADDFQITLDSHFISSMLHTYYGNPGIRVTRHALPNEKSHQVYYDRLGYIRVFAKPFIAKGIAKKTIKNENKQFYKTAIDKLQNDMSLVCSPEGISHQTPNSPGPFKKGVFALASSMNPQPKIVPIVLANLICCQKILNTNVKSWSLFECRIMGFLTLKTHRLIRLLKPSTGGIKDG